MIGLVVGTVFALLEDVAKYTVRLRLRDIGIELWAARCDSVLMAADQFQKGLVNIHAALIQALSDRGIAPAAVSHDFRAGDEGSVAFTVSAAGQQQIQAFSREEIIDSGQAIDAPSAHKVRMTISHFIPQNDAQR